MYFCFLIHSINCVFWLGNWVHWYLWCLLKGVCWLKSFLGDKIFVFVFLVCVHNCSLNFNNYEFVFYTVSWLYLLLTSIWPIAFNILCRVGLTTINSFSLFLWWKLFLSPSTMTDSFPGHCSLGWDLWSFRTWSVLMFLLENQLLCWWVFLYIWFFCYSLAASYILSLVCVFSVISIICLGEFLFWSSLLVLCVHPISV